MDNLPIMGIAILGYFVVVNFIKYLDNNAQRKHELDKEKLRLSSRFIIAPYISSLLGDLISNGTDVDVETKSRLVAVLKSMQLNYSSDNQNLTQLNNDKITLKEILENGNLAADIGLKLKQLFDLIQ